ncbi:Alpha/Beta hydrolase protein [Globomyces pollinis-pini]|nr:Alpha/Beta hydrolase protein [Globomyces pollinis-pini]
MGLHLKKGCGYFSTQPKEVGFVPIKNYKLHYEIHGHGEIKLVFIMGMMSSMASWEPNLHHFANLNGDKYTCLVFDNRGMGYSTNGTFERYTTKELAKDAASLLEHIGWDEYRSLHLCGISMGGMISQELALMMPDRFKSVTLLATCAKHQSPKDRVHIMFQTLKPPITKRMYAENYINMVLSDEKWASQPNPRFPQYKSNLDYAISDMLARMNDGSPLPGLPTFVGHGLAVLTHNVSNNDLIKLGIHIPEILIITGELDKMIDKDCSRLLAKHTGGKCFILEGKGHGIMLEADDVVNAEMVKIIDEGERRWSNINTI